MTLDEAIKHCEEVAEEQNKLCERCDRASGYSRSHNESIRTNDAKKHEKCGQEHIQLVAWLRELKAYKEQEPCTDAISRKAVIDMTGLSEWFDSSDSYNGFVIALSELPSVTLKQKTGKWIPVSERLPEEGKTVMASTNYGIYPEARYSEKYGWKWPWEVGEDYWTEIVDSVEAWMPLPEPYKAESEGK
jgi:hypothetical protein